MDAVIKAFFIVTFGAVLVLCGANFEYPTTPKNTQHLSPLFCFNNYGEEHLSDVCSKIGKTWPV